MYAQENCTSHLIPIHHSINSLVSNSDNNPPKCRVFSDKAKY